MGINRLIYPNELRFEMDSLDRDILRIKNSQKETLVRLSLKEIIGGRLKPLKIEKDKLSDSLKKMKEDSFKEKELLEKELSKIKEINKKQELELSEEKREKELISRRTKEHLISLMPNKDKNLIDKDLDFILELYNQVKGYSTNPKEKLIPDKAPLSDTDYIKSQKCFCGEQKASGSKGCKEHKKQARRWADRTKEGMPSGWEYAYEDYAKSIRGRSDIDE